MSTSPKSSLVERLVQDRLRTGELEASAAHLLQLGDNEPGSAANTAASGAPVSLSNGDAGPGAQVRLPLVPTPLGATSLNSNGHGSLDTLGPGSLVPNGAALAPRSYETDFRSDPVPAQGPSAPMALELRPLADPAPKPLATPIFPLPGLAPSALVPPPATALPVSGQPSMAPPLEPVPQPQQSATPLAAPPIISQIGASMEERSDLVQGPPTIDAVALERGGMVDWSRTRSRISEEFRLVQRQILRAAFGPGAEPGFSNLLMVTSARPGEGKSFTAVNLAGSIARQGDHHVLLVDADSKRDSFCYALGLAEMRGLLDLVANPKLDPSPLIVKTPIDRLSILPVGRERERSAELFSTKEMTRLIQSLGRRYADRLLVLDSPPCLSTSDPAVLAPVVGQILFVVEADRTQRDEVEASLDLIQACPNITLVLNKQQASSRYTFGAYSSYYSS
jgi:receptor protein-tyrosine kinase